ncbi:alpha/beta hydrolase [Amycolatopsis suaedae]|uniref:alpha/beta hydrolase n=1 Tax=Amycolatopsis suaedae TaxID=2510978 RepID=UPI0013EF34C3|nr:alpha/beta hydrolase [Amycolatopsis suaedae]
MNVPVDHREPDGERLSMAVARRTAGDPAARVGTLVYLPAGPGSSGVQAVTDDAIFRLVFPPEVARRFDIVGFDPRGVGRSNPVVCDPAVVARLQQLPEPADQAGFDRLLATQADVGADCRRRTGPVFDHLDSNDIARDVDALRAALGESTINLYGLSYGTVHGQMYAERFPDRIRTLILDAVFDHSVDSDTFARTGAVAAQESFGQFVAWCDRTPDCALHGTDVRATVAALFTRAEQGSLPDPDDPARPLTPSGLTSRIVSPLTRPDLPGVAADIARLSGGTAGQPRTVAAGEPIRLPIYLSCADNVNRTRSFAAAQRLREQSRRLAPDMRESAFEIASLCINPPVPATNPQRRLHAPAAPPVLVLNARYDASTPHAGAVRVARQLPRATLLTYDGMGHGAATRTPCTRDAVLRYLTDRVLPSPGAHCPAG